MSDTDASRPEPESGSEPLSVPGIGGPGSEETAPDGRRALRLHAKLSAAGAVLSIFVTLVFVLVLDSIGPAIVFGIVAVASVGWGGWAVWRLRRTRDAAR